MSELKNFNRMFSLDGKVALVTGGELQRLCSRRGILTDDTT